MQKINRGEQFGNAGYINDVLINRIDAEANGASHYTAEHVIAAFPEYNL